MKRLSPGFFFLFLLLFPTLSPAVTITGNVALKGQITCTGVTVLFQRIAPSALRDSTVADGSGNYSINLQSGIYTVAFSKSGYFGQSLSELSLYSSRELPDVTLIPSSTRLLVPGDFSTIQSAIDAARAADTVLVSPGTYLENINFKGKNITVGSLFVITGDNAHVSNTIIDGNKMGRVATFSGGEDSTAVLCGLTLANGDATQNQNTFNGGGVYCPRTAHPTLKRLLITGNTAAYGGGVYTEGSAKLLDSILEKNYAHGGSGIYISYADARVVNTVIRGNTSDGVTVQVYGQKPLFRNTSIHGNAVAAPLDARYHIAVQCSYSDAVFSNCIVSDNQGKGFSNDNGGNPSITYCAVWNHANGNFFQCSAYTGKNVTVNANGDSCDAFTNIQADPRFVDPVHGDFSLRETSPCIGAGDTESAPSTDILGATRGTPPDMGAYENQRDVPLPRYISITSPRGGEELVRGTRHTITWTSSEEGSAKIEYTTGNGAGWETISPEVETASGSFEWNVPDTVSRNCQIRITTAATPAVTAQSERAFSIIIPGVTLTAPKGGEQWLSGRITPITWESGGVSTVRLEFSKDNGASWDIVAASVEAADSAYAWTIPDTPSSQCLVRITDTDDATHTDVSGAVFSILPAPFLRLTTPNGGESWRAGSSGNIAWESSGVQRIKVEYTLNGGTDWTMLEAGATADSGKLAWTLPDIVSTACMVRISDADYPALADTSASPFSILQHNATAGFTVDSDLARAKHQGPDRVVDMGGGISVGFALYAKEWDSAAGFSLTLSWDPERVSFRNTLSSPNIADEPMTINGTTVTPALEENILGGSILTAGEEKSPGVYTRSFAAIGEVGSIEPDGLIFFAVFKTAASFTVDDTLSIRCTVKLADREGMESDLGVRFFRIMPAIKPPPGLIVSDAPGDQGHSLALSWTPSPSEQNGMVSYYRIYRSLTSTLSDSVRAINTFDDIRDITAWERHAAVLVDSVIVGTRGYIDTAVGLSGVPYYYWIQAVGMGGESAKVAAGVPTIVEDRNALPSAVRLWEARPNPFNPSTVIGYSLPRDTRALLRVYNVTGQKVATLVEGTVSAGDHSVVWDARGMPSGVYFYTLTAEGGFSETKKALLLK